MRESKAAALARSGWLAAALAGLTLTGCTTGAVVSSGSAGQTGSMGVAGAGAAGTSQSAGAAGAGTAGTGPTSGAAGAAPSTGTAGRATAGTGGGAGAAGSVADGGARDADQFFEVAPPPLATRGATVP